MTDYESDRLQGCRGGLIALLMAFVGTVGLLAYLIYLLWKN